MRRVISSVVEIRNTHTMPKYCSLAFYMMDTAVSRLPANLLQAQRDYLAPTPTKE